MGMGQDGWDGWGMGGSRRNPRIPRSIPQWIPHHGARPILLLHGRLLGFAGRVPRSPQWDNPQDSQGVGGGRGSGTRGSGIGARQRGTLGAAKTQQWEPGLNRDSVSAAGRTKLGNREVRVQRNTIYIHCADQTRQRLKSRRRVRSCVRGVRGVRRIRGVGGVRRIRGVRGVPGPRRADRRSIGFEGPIGRGGSRGGRAAPSAATVNTSLQLSKIGRAHV